MEIVSITCRCPLCGQITTVFCLEDQWNAYEEGALAQVAFADVDIRTRETLISGMCVPCQVTFFEGEEE